MLLATNLDSHRTSPPNAITAWYERRVQLGMALIGHPDVLVLDEPTRAIERCISRLRLPLETLQIHCRFNL